jgi:preprotein translocase subunit SecG
MMFFIYSHILRYNPPAFNLEVVLITYFQIALIITSLALIVSIVLQNKGVGLGGLTGQDAGGVFSARRGIEKTLFLITTSLAIIFVILVMLTIALAK